MKVAVWDTYVTRTDGGLMHFDIVVPADLKTPETIYNFGKDYLRSRQQDGQPLTTNECTFCHIEAAGPEVVSSIERQGYYIIEMEGCT